jgi:hypothetical protein
MAAKPKADYQPQCAALTGDGKQCRNSARGASKYCASHKGYQPPAGKGLAQRIEGKSWSASDKLTDSASRKQADTKPSVRRAKDTVLAVRKAGAAKAAKATARKAKPTRRGQRPRHIPFAPVGGDDTTGATSDPGYVANILQEERDYLVVYEEPDTDGLPTEDNLLLDIDAGQPVSLGEVNLEQKLDLELSNNTNWVGRLGFVLAIVGAIIGFSVLIFFGTTYPERWYDDQGNPAEGSILPGTALVGVIAVLMQLAGVVLTHYGRRIQARGNLSRMRIVEKAFQPRVALGDETA